jgi:hypothetical protein
MNKRQASQCSPTQVRSDEWQREEEIILCVMEGGGIMVARFRIMQGLMEHWVRYNRRFFA